MSLPDSRVKVVFRQCHNSFVYTFAEYSEGLYEFAKKREPNNVLVGEVSQETLDRWKKTREEYEKVQDEIQEAYITKWSFGTWNGKERLK